MIEKIVNWTLENPFHIGIILGIAFIVAIIGTKIHDFFEK